MEKTKRHGVLSIGPGDSCARPPRKTAEARGTIRHPTVPDERGVQMSSVGKHGGRPPFPDPLAPGSFLERIATLGLPASALSLVSLLAFLIVLMAVQHSAALRSHYTLFPAWPRLAALGAAALAWGIAYAGSRRPGRMWPRLWALGLATLATLIALAAMVRPAGLPTPQLHALITATLAAALALTPRLLHIHPDSDWTQRCAPLSLLLTLGLILPPALIGPAESNRTSAQQGGDRPADHRTIAVKAPDEAVVRTLMDGGLFALGETAYLARDLPQLWGLDLARARGLVTKGGTGCSGQAGTGPDGGFRIVCPLPAIAADARVATVRAEVRILFGQRSGGRSPPPTPIEVRYAFPIPPGVSDIGRTRFQQAVLSAFGEALTDGGLSVSTLSRKGKADQGLRVKGRSQVWKVPPPRIDQQGADQDWLVLRVLPD